MHSRRKRFESTRYTTTMLKLSQWFEARGWHDQPVSKEAALLFATIGDVAPGLIERRWGSLLAWPSRSICAGWCAR